ncbi:MAG: type I restriction enzyme HsdR N-terminal domain-containing protein [Flavobacteriaceae bacterium]|nr:type I restriction enzyme HsdR N-terminal domain-containing protein [Flavobacteriaceae bacterium]
MKKLNLPLFEFKIKKENKNNIIFDEIRKKWIILTPEEWIRQNFIKYIILKKYPASHINCEKVFYINKVQKRYDIVVYNSSGEVEILVECKSPDIKINNDHFDQVMRYNIKLKSKRIIVTNGLENYYFKFNEKNKEYIQEKDLINYSK